MCYIRSVGSLVLSGTIGSRRQTLYLVVTLAIAVATWFVLAAIATPVTVHSGSKNSGVGVTNGSQGTPVLPLRYAKRLMKVQGAHDVSWTTLQTITCGPNSTVVTLNAYGGPGAVRALAADQSISESALQRWSVDPLGVIINARTSRDCGWKVGQGVSPDTGMGASLELHVSGIFHAPHAAGDLGFAHFDYINRTGSMLGKDKVVQYTAYASDPRKAELLAAHIEQEFAHDFPTVAAFTNTTVQNAWARFGKVQLLIALVMVAVFLCAASVLISVLAHAAAQRRHIFAVLQVFGFGRSVMFAAFALQAFLILVIGAMFGAGASLGVRYLVVSNSVVSFTTAGFNIPNWAYLWLPVWLAVLLVSALGWPALLISRVRPVHHKEA